MKIIAGIAFLLLLLAGCQAPIGDHATRPTWSQVDIQTLPPDNETDLQLLQNWLVHQAASVDLHCATEVETGTDQILMRFRSVDADCRELSWDDARPAWHRALEGGHVPELIETWMQYAVENHTEFMDRYDWSVSNVVESSAQYYAIGSKVWHDYHGMDYAIRDGNGSIENDESNQLSFYQKTRAVERLHTIYPDWMAVDPWQGAQTECRVADLAGQRDYLVDRLVEVKRHGEMNGFFIGWSSQALQALNQTFVPYEMHGAAWWELTKANWLLDAAALPLAHVPNANESVAILERFFEVNPTIFAEGQVARWFPDWTVPEGIEMLDRGEDLRRMAGALPEFGKHASILNCS